MSGTSGSARSGTVAATTAAAAAVLALLATGCGGGDSGAAPSPDSTYSAVVAGAEPPPADGFTSVEVQGIKIDAPKNWSIDNTGGRLCMRPPGRDACGYGSIQVLPKVAKNDANKWPEKQFNQPDGWASDTSACRSLGAAEAGDVPVTGAESLEVDNPEGLMRHADGLRSHHREWKVDCENGDVFEVRLWFLPESDIAVYVWSADVQYSALYDEVAASMNTDDYKRD